MILLPEKKIDTIYEMTIFRTMDITQRRTVTLERQETNDASSMIAPAHHFERVSRPRGKKWGSQLELGRYPNLKDRAENPERPG